MKYRKDRYGNDLSVLGYGCMRFTSGLTGIDIEKAKSEIRAAYEAGVNYYDTAYIYPGSEAALGRILEDLGIRDKVNIASKLPHYLMRKPGDAEKYFSQELERLRTDHIDYYLMHMLTDIKTWDTLCELGVREWIAEKKASGQIRQVGFSYHGNADMFMKLVDAYDWDFCQIQYNYIDETSQAGVRGLRYAHEKGLPVIIMEPLRGGKLAAGLPNEAVKAFAAMTESGDAKRGEKTSERGDILPGEGDADPAQWCRTPAQWGLTWLWNQPEVTVVLSGMNSLQMVKENTDAASQVYEGCLSEAELAGFGKVRDAINGKTKVGCTGCSYCMPCPHGVDIPGTFAAYNSYYNNGMVQGIKEYVMCTALRKDRTGAGKCIGCGACELKCPQHLEIRKNLKDAASVLERAPYKVSAAVIGLFRSY